MKWFPGLDPTWQDVVAFFAGFVLSAFAVTCLLAWLCMAKYLSFAGV